MDELERALRAVLDDPAQLNELRALAGSLGLGQTPAAPEPAPVSAPVSAPEAQAASVADAPPPQSEAPRPAAAASFAPRTRGGTLQEALLQALRPFLRKDRQEKIERALQAARLAGLARLALGSRSGGSGKEER